MSASDYPPLWIRTFNKELLRTMSFSEHEAFDHPVACLLVVSSKDERPINKFVDLFNTDQLPSLLNEGAMDPKILKHYLLLHDAQDGALEKATNILADMRSTFGSNDCNLLCMNSSLDGLVEWQNNPWAPYANSPSDRDVGCFLNIDDLYEIKDFMQNLTSKLVIPQMEQKIRILNQQVSATRKGFRNQIKNLWWRKGKEDSPDISNGPMYTFSSIESQIRVLGDYAFMLRDYELALSNYRLLSTDYKLDKAWKRYAGVQEMMGLSYFMLDQSRKESEYCMESAFNTYLKLGSSGQRNATRCGLWWTEMLKARGQFKEAAGIYFRISSEEPSLHAAVMLEQASYCYLFSNPPMLRKYGFHLVLAGNRYYISDQRQHAIRTYKNAIFVYKGNGWNYISDHVHFNIGRWYAFLGVFDVAVKHMQGVLSCKHQSLITQDLFLNDFLHAAQNLGTTFEVNELQLPVIDMSSLRVIYEDHRTYASSADIRANESIWQSLEEDLVPSVSTFKSNWLESQPKFSLLNKYNNSSLCVVGEPIKISLEFKNPLQIPISLSGISLIFELSPRSEATEFEDAEVEGDAELAVPPISRDIDADSQCTLSEVGLVLGGAEIKRVQLDITPKIEGVLKIIGVQWRLSGSVTGYRYFGVDAKKKYKQGTRVSRQSPSNNLNFVVIKGLPKLEGCILGIPKKTFAGDLRLVKLELKKQTNSSVKNVKMKISHPRFLIPGNIEDLSADFPRSLEKQTTSEDKDAPDCIMEKSRSHIFSFPEAAALTEGGTSFTWPLWFHASLAGTISLYISIYYEMDNGCSELGYRTLRMHYDIEVLPSVDVSLLFSPCPSRLQEFLVRMDIVNRTISESFCLNQLSSIGSQWEISSLPGFISICPLEVLLAGQKISCFFKLKDCQKISGYENKHLVASNDVLLNSDGKAEMLIDISQSPVVDFHHFERLNQEAPQGSSTAVDFILFSKVQGSNLHEEPETTPKLLSNHVCNCSITTKSPIWWLMDGPRTIMHDFSTFCEVNLTMAIHNCSEAIVSVRIATFDFVSETKQSAETTQSSDSSGCQGGWSDISLVNDIKLSPDPLRNMLNIQSSGSTPPFVWCASSSTRIKLAKGSAMEVPLKICVFSPGTYNLSQYELHWNQESSEGSGAELSITSSGMQVMGMLHLCVYTFFWPIDTVSLLMNNELYIQVC
ncbi:trafficking protein particle complex subunit 8 isoform X3 [Dioscorea cayenensis subsp. rotundata]|nr:trafficking protein particle complex subunit 8 isoform X3 [Dioscorea cayenensis subsp. rotundata]